MDPDDILQRQYEQLDREKREQMMKLRTQEKRIDYLARAMRIDEIPLLEKHFAEKKVHDQKEFEHEEVERVSFKKNLFILKNLFFFCSFINLYPMDRSH